jgi:hypothetical protein
MYAVLLIVLLILDGRGRTGESPPLRMKMQLHYAERIEVKTSLQPDDSASSVLTTQ